MNRIRYAMALVFMLSLFSFLAGCSHNDGEPSVSLIGITSPDKKMLLMPDPWPYEFQKHEEISEHDAKRAQMIVGLATLCACSNVIVTVPENDYTEADIAVVLVIRPDESWGFWYVNLTTGSRLGEFSIISLDVETLAVYNVGTGDTFTAEMIDDLAELEQNRDQIMYAALALDIDIEGKALLRDIWNKVKDAWNEMNTCQQVHLVVGIVGCGMAGPEGIPCGVAVWISSAINC